MKANETSLLGFLKNAEQFSIPIYQRTYSWTERECLQLWTDILRAGRNEDVGAHFVGSVVYIQSGPYNVSKPDPLLVIDGQQRLTTICLLLEALARRLGNLELVEGFSARKIRAYYLLNDLEEGERAFKLILTQTDKDTLLAILRQSELPKEPSIRVERNFSLFQDWLSRFEDDDLVALCIGLGKLLIVDVSLQRELDNPQLIFESMNSTGKELSQADLIRNFILMGLEQKHQTNLYENIWRPTEVDFGQESYGSQFDAFVRHYLTLKSEEIPNRDAVYEAFKNYAGTPAVEAAGVDALVEDLRKFAKYYCAMALGKEKNETLKSTFQDLRELKVEVAYPFLLELYEDYEKDILSLQDFATAVRLIESYVFRRAVCSIPAASLNKTFATFSRNIRKDAYLESIKAFFMLLPSYRRFPLDEEFKREIIVRDLYNFRSRSYWLRQLENFNRKERVVVGEYTIEHIMPQKENLTPEWQASLGADWERVHLAKLHTLGNLTLTAYNSEYGAKPFIEKRDMDGGFKSSPLQLNIGLGDLENWNEPQIEARALRLATLAAKVWIAPDLNPEVLSKYKPKETRGHSHYSLEDFNFLYPGTPQRTLFNSLRREILALDECVTEEILKLYIAFKAETNFVDVVPQASRLRLSLNMPYHELNDPRGIAKDITGLGRWGNGDVEIGLTGSEQLPYVLGLIRQSFERQMGSSNIAS